MTSTEQQQEKQGRKTVFERTYRASAQDVWDLWTTKEGFESWWGPQGFRAEVHELDVRPGGAFRYDMIADTPEMIAAMAKMGAPRSHKTHGRFTEVDALRRLVISNVIDFLPGVAAYESLIVVELSASAGSVRMVVTLDGMHDPTTTQMQKEGFASQLTKLDARFG